MIVKCPYCFKNFNSKNKHICPIKCDCCGENHIIEVIKDDF